MQMAGETMNGDVVMREQLSAFADGELVSAQCAQAMEFADSDEGRASWHEFHLIGDVLRSSELARPASCDLVSRLREQLAKEAGAAQLQRGETVQIVVQQAEQIVVRPAAAAVGISPRADGGTEAVEAANHDVFRWKMVAGFASLAAVATIGWNAYTGLSGGAASQPGMQLAAAPVSVESSVGANVGSAATAVAVNVPVQVSNGQQGIMIRDPRLDELLAAHKQYGSTSALQMPAGFLRNATFEAPAR